MRPEEQEEAAGKLRKELEDYYGTAMQQCPAAMADLERIRSMSDAEILEAARDAGII